MFSGGFVNAQIDLDSVLCNIVLSHQIYAYFNHYLLLVILMCFIL